MNKLQEQELFELEEQQQEERPVYVIEDLSGLDRALRKMHELQKEIKEIKQIAKAGHDYYDAWEKKECAKYESELASLEYRVTEYHASVLEKDPTKKSIPMAFGTVKSRKTEAQPEKTDEAALIVYAKTNELAFVEVETKEKLKWAELKKTLSVVESDGKLTVVDADGQVVPGVIVKPETGSFKVEVSE